MRGDVADGVDVGCRRPQAGVGADTAVVGQFQPGGVREAGPRRGADGHQHDVRGKLVTTLETDAGHPAGTAGEAGDAFTQTPVHAVLGVQVLEDSGHLLAQYREQR